jgi:hypothetical protein
MEVIETAARGLLIAEVAWQSVSVGGNCHICERAVRIGRAEENARNVHQISRYDMLWMTCLSLYRSLDDDPFS